MKNIYYIIVILLICNLSCHRYEDKAKRINLIECLSNLSSNKKYCRDFKIEKCVPDEWDNLIIIKPYDDIVHIFEEKDIPIAKNMKKENIERRDDICILVFVSNGHIKYWSVIPLGIMDFSSVKASSLTRENSRFYIHEPADEDWRFVHIADGSTIEE